MKQGQGSQLEAVSYYMKLCVSVCVHVCVCVGVGVGVAACVLSFHCVL